MWKTVPGVCVNGSEPKIRQTTNGSRFLLGKSNLFCATRFFEIFFVDGAPVSPRLPCRSRCSPDP